MVSIEELLDQEGLTDEQAQELLAPAQFGDARAALRVLRRLGLGPEGRSALSELLPQLLTHLGGVANPDGALVSLERFTAVQPDGPAFLDHLAQNPRELEILATLFAASQFLTEILLRHPEYYSRLVNPAGLGQILSAEDYRAGGLGDVQNCPDQPTRLDALRRFQRWHLLRIGACDLLGQLDLSGVTRQLSNLADGMIQVCLELAADELRVDDGYDPAEGFAVIAMGKLGGAELNYSSDIDLLFVSSRDTAWHARLGEKLIQALTAVTGEGFLYRVDMRLRPWGRVGALVPTLDSYAAYLHSQARLWEKQALLKARPASGDPLCGEEFLQRVTPFVFQATSEPLRDQVAQMKRRTEAHLRQQGRGWGEVKLGEGSIRDIEFVVQYLQMAHGARQPEIRSRSTLDGLRRLRAYKLIGPDDARRLEEGYLFMRVVEHHLQLMHYRQTTSLPRNTQSLHQLALRLGFRSPSAGDDFLARYAGHVASIRAVYLSQMEDRPMEPEREPQDSSPEVRRHLARMDPSYKDTFSPRDIARHTEMAEALDAGSLARVDAAALQDGEWRVTIVAYDYPGELSLICGLMFVYGMNILDGDVFTYEPVEGPTPAGRRKIVDVFTIRPQHGEVNQETWDRYAAELEELLQDLQARKRQEASVRLAKRAAGVLEGIQAQHTPLYPIDIAIDNESSERYTILRISGNDTPGFLYELTNALAFNRIYIARVEIETHGARVHDTLYVTGEDEKKITQPERQRELRAATVLIKGFTHLLPLSPDPEAALLHFHAFLGDLFRRPGWPNELASLERPEVLSALARLLGVSDFLWDDFLRMQHANLFPVVRDIDALDAAISAQILGERLEQALADAPADHWQDALNAFKDREMFRVDMRLILGHTHEIWDFSTELSDLAEVVVRGAFRGCLNDMEVQYSHPLEEDGSPARIAVLALGKFGGQEMGFGSDLELMLVYTRNGRTDGEQSITTAEFYEKVVERLSTTIRARRKGIFEIDLQLRPYGKAGSLAVSLESYRRYFGPGGPAWPYERQALVRLRPVAGDEALGQQLSEMRDVFVYTGLPFDVNAMRAMRERQVRHLVKGGTFNPKFSPGGLVDVEYLVQALQITHGAANPALRQVNTHKAMSALSKAGVLGEDDYTRLRKAHTFLRWLIDSLRIVAGHAKDLSVPPEDSEEFSFLARRLRYGPDRLQLKEDLQRYSSYVQEANRRLLGG